MKQKIQWQCTNTISLENSQLLINSTSINFLLHSTLPLFLVRGKHWKWKGIVHSIVTCLDKDYDYDCGIHL
jgi:hypothetical protein